MNVKDFMNEINEETLLAGEDPEQTKVLIETYQGYVQVDHSQIRIKYMDHPPGTDEEVWLALNNGGRFLVISLVGADKLNDHMNMIW